MGPNWATSWAGPPVGTWVDFRNYQELLGRCLMQHFALAFQETLDFDDLADLRAQRSEVLDVVDDAAPVLAKVGTVGRGQIWAWYRYSKTADNGTDCIRPDDVDPADPGRWHKQTLPHVARCGTTRYYRHVGWCDATAPIFGGGKDRTSLWTRCNGDTPALFISYVGDEIEEASQTQALHRVTARYKLRVLGANWRGGVEAEMTPGREEDQEDSPGNLRLVGELRDYLLKDNRLLGTDGTRIRGTAVSLGMLGAAVLRTRLGGHRPAVRRGPNRVVCDEVDISCIVATWTPNTPCELVSPFRIWVQMQDALGENAGPENQMVPEPESLLEVA